MDGNTYMCTCVVLVQVLAVLGVAAPGRGLDDGRPEEPRIIDVPGNVEGDVSSDELVVY
jgi:hypothetical protein